MVIHERTPAAWGWVPQMPPGLGEWAATLDLAGLDDDLALAVRHFLARNRQIREPARSQLGQRLAREVAAVTNPPPPPGTPGWAYLAAVHAERHRARPAPARRRPLPAPPPSGPTSPPRARPLRHATHPFPSDPGAEPPMAPNPPSPTRQRRQRQPPAIVINSPEPDRHGAGVVRLAT